MAALAVERLCRGDAYVEVDVLATKREQAAIMVEAAKRFVRGAAGARGTLRLVRQSGHPRVPADGLEAHGAPGQALLAPGPELLARRSSTRSGSPRTRSSKR